MPWAAKNGPAPGVARDMVSFQQILYVSFKHPQVSALGPLGPLVLYRGLCFYYSQYMVRSTPTTAFNGAM